MKTKIFKLTAAFTMIVLLLTMTVACDMLKGPQGDKGEQGAQGIPGKDGITPEFKLDGGDIWVSYDGGVTWETLGNVNNPVCQHRDIDDDYICDKCGNPYADGTDVPVDTEHTHSYGEWKYFSTSHEYCDEALYYRTCPGCNVIEWRDGEESDHSYTTVTIAPTCISNGYDKKTCSECGKEVVFNETAKVAHDYSDTYTIDASYHWMQCTYCADVKDKAEHIINGDGYCIVCEQPVGPTEGVIYDYSIDGTYAEVIGYNGTSTQIVIADTYNGLPVKNIYKKAFYENTNITSVLIPDSVTTIGRDSFCYCLELTSVTIGDSVTSIGDGAFALCSGLTSVTIPDSVTSIGASAFYDCSKLTSVTIPDGVTSIGEDAFSCCSKLTSVTIGDSVTSIGEGAFYLCNKLNTVYYAGTADDWANISIVGSNSELKNATRYYYSETEPAVSGNFWHYVDGEVVVW